MEQGGGTYGHLRRSDRVEEFDISVGGVAVVVHGLGRGVGRVVKVKKLCELYSFTPPVSKNVPEHSYTPYL
jgi:hypothetical protein